MGNRYAQRLFIGGDIPASAAPKLLTLINACVAPVYISDKAPVAADATPGQALTALMESYAYDEELATAVLCLSDDESRDDTFDDLQAFCERLGIAFDLQSEDNCYGSDGTSELRYRPGIGRHFWQTAGYQGERLVSRADAVKAIREGLPLDPVLGPEMADLTPFRVVDDAPGPAGCPRPDALTHKTYVCWCNLNEGRALCVLDLTPEIVADIFTKRSAFVAARAIDRELTWMVYRDARARFFLAGGGVDDLYKDCGNLPQDDSWHLLPEGALVPPFGNYRTGYPSLKVSAIYACFVANDHGVSDRFESVDLFWSLLDPDGDVTI